MVSKEIRLVRSLSNKSPNPTPTNELILPNHSGISTHREFIQPFANIYGNEIGFSQVAAVLDTWYPISDSDMTDGYLNLITHDGNGKLTFSKPGYYQVIVSTSLESSVANKHLQVGVRVNTTVQGALNHIEPLGANAQQPVTINLIVYISSIGDTLEAVVRTTDAGAPTIRVDHLTINVSRLRL